MGLFLAIFDERSPIAASISSAADQIRSVRNITWTIWQMGTVESADWMWDCQGVAGIVTTLARGNYLLTHSETTELNQPRTVWQWGMLFLSVGTDCHPPHAASDSSPHLAGGRLVVVVVVVVTVLTTLGMACSHLLPQICRGSAGIKIYFLLIMWFISQWQVKADHRFYFLAHNWISIGKKILIPFNLLTTNQYNECLARHCFE